ncbi:MAG TPA: DUF3108 domain-containing protein [Dongiaceae bacterium]|jgi:hypothetical protein|nr:DUF3108 domain-containing protein [Dongiaceae bacterium]
MRLSVLFLLAVFSVPLAFAQTPAPSASSSELLPSLPFAPGEELNFAVKYGMVRAGDAKLAVLPGKSADNYRLLSTAKSSRFFDTFFPVDDRIISEWSPTLGAPVEFEKRSREGKYKKDESLRFDQERGLALHANGKRAKISPGTQDVLSAFYVVRAHKLVPETSFQVPSYADGKNYQVMVKVHQRETVDVPAGHFACLIVEPLLQTSGLFKQEGRLLIWVTDDARHMPVQMKSKVAVGSIVAELESFRMGQPPSSADPGREGTVPTQGNAGGR